MLLASPSSICFLMMLWFRNAILLPVLESLVTIYCFLLDRLVCFLRTRGAFIQWFTWFICCLIPCPLNLSRHLINSPASMPFSLIHACIVFLLLLIRMSDVPPNQNHPPTVDPTSSVPSHNANLFYSSQFSHDGSPSGPQLPIDLDGCTSNNPSGKGKATIPTFSWAVKFGVGGLSGDSVPRART